MDRVSPARRGARAAEAPVLGLAPRESERAQESASALRAQATTRNEREGWYVGARAWRRRHGGLSLVQCPTIAYGPSVASAARRARGGSARAGPCPYTERASERRRARARYARKPPRAMRGRAGTWEQGPGADGTAASRSCSALPLRMDRVSPARRGARAAAAPVLGLAPRESERAQESASALRAQATTRNEREGWHVGARAWRRRNGGLSLVQCPSIAYGPSVASAARRARGGGARAGPRPPERASERRRARARYARKPPRAMRGRAGTWEHGPGADGTAASRSCSALPLRMDRVSPARRGARAAEAPVLGLVPIQRASSSARSRCTGSHARSTW